MSVGRYVDEFESRWGKKVERDPRNLFYLRTKPIQASDFLLCVHDKYYNSVLLLTVSFVKDLSLVCDIHPCTKIMFKILVLTTFLLSIFAVNLL
jgi:hypothetical protein